MTTHFHIRGKQRMPRFLTAIVAGIALFAGASLPAHSQGIMHNDSVGTAKPNSIQLRSGRYCTSNGSAIAALQVSNHSASVQITGRHPDSRGYNGNPRNGFSGEGFSIMPVSSNTIRITQHQYGVTRNFKSC